ncbi:MAG: UDP-N-acetylmuramate--L-alanine ligase [Opitutaceae bacterium]
MIDSNRLLEEKVSLMKLYFMGICGTGMGNAALLLRAKGHEVVGADSGVYPPMSTVLHEAGIEILEGYDPARLERLRPDAVVIGNAMSRGHPEVEWLWDTRTFPVLSLPEALSRFILGERRNLVVCGTHGKTTTTALAAFLLRENGRNPGFLIGGVPQDPPVGQFLGGAGEPFVIEGDEYDSAFFDKRSKFIHYAPHIAVLNNLEFDHADIFRDLADVQRAFAHLARIVPRRGWLVLNGDDGNLAALGPTPWTRVARVGEGPDNDGRIEGFSESASGAEFDLSWKGRPWGRIRWPLPGLFNARNAAMAAVAAGLALTAEGGRGGASYPAEADPRALRLDALDRFRGVRRRQEIKAAVGGLTIMEDFGHHPTALSETLRSLRSRFPGARLTAVFEPRSNTARGRALQTDFLTALTRADEVYLGPVNRAEKLCAEERFDAPDVAARLKAAGIDAEAFPGNAGLLDRLAARTLPPAGVRRVVVFFSNGSFDGIVARYTDAALISRP